MPHDTICMPLKVVIEGMRGAGLRHCRNTTMLDKECSLSTCNVRSSKNKPRNWVLMKRLRRHLKLRCHFECVCGLWLLNIAVSLHILLQ